MKGYLILIILIVSLFIAGCTSNPSESGSAPSNPVTTSTQGYMSEATQFGTPTIIQTHPTMSSPTLSPENMVCMIDRREQVFTGVNKYANAFNLVSPPMYINYTILDTKAGSNGRYASYYTITIRDKKTGTIISQSGFGKNRDQGGYSDSQFGGYDVIRVMKSNDLLIEKEGKDITIISEIWVQPSGNLDSSFDIKNAKCINWPQAFKEGVMHTPWGQSVMNVGIERT